MWSGLNQITTQCLLALNGLEEGFEIPRAKAGEVVALDDFNEDGRTVHEVL